jgi:hypothetical protein
VCKLHRPSSRRKHGMETAGVEPATEPDVRGFDGHVNPQRQRFLIFHCTAYL